MNKFIKYVKNKLFFLKLKKGKLFSRREKRKLLKVIELSKAEILNIPKETICRGLRVILETNCYKVIGSNKGTDIYIKLKNSYHNPEYYIYKKLFVLRKIAYWWDRHDRKSRLKALDILREAIIND